jgi:hypothetical protein
LIYLIGPCDEDEGIKNCRPEDWNNTFLFRLLAMVTYACKVHLCVIISQLSLSFLQRKKESSPSPRTSPSSGKVKVLYYQEFGGGFLKS